MKYCYTWLAAAALGLGAGAAWAQILPNFVYEQEREFIATGDFDGDGRPDVVIIDKASGKYRLGYQQSAGVFTWVNHRLCGLKDVSGVSVGKLFDAKKDALALASADANKLVAVAADDLEKAGTPMPIQATVLGPNAILAVEVGGDGNTPLHDLYLGSVYNEPNKVIWFRNDGLKFAKVGEMATPAGLGKANRLSLKTGAPELVAVVLSDDKNDVFKVEDLRGGKPVAVATISGLPANSDYLVGHFRGLPLAEVIFYKAGEKQLTVYPVAEEGGQFKFGAAQAVALEQPVRKAYALGGGGAAQLLLIFGNGESAAVCSFDGAKTPTVVQALANKDGEMFLGAAVLPDGFILLTAAPRGRFSARYYQHQCAGDKIVAGKYGTLASMDDTDESTLPEIHKRIVATLEAKSEAEMKAYTNTIPGTTATYAMVPIPGGEFLMGSPAAEAGRKPDEGPPHKVKIAPFWMGKYEVTWNEYEIFMYADDEKKLRETIPTDPEVDKVSDAVARPSKPYVEMSFGMGKDGFPAISMCQHGANKYCQWLSAKTGHYYRLPTEAEWEYACRAGTTTAYSFGDDASKLGEYAWSGANSDFKYQKAGKKKPNPWGLHDMHGNVLEWCLDQYDPEYYKQFTSLVENPWNKATQPYPHAARGGSWDDDNPAVFRSAARRGSDRAWKATDPQLPKSVWYHSDAQFIGFRIVRPLAVPPADQIGKYWISGVEKD